MKVKWDDSIQPYQAYSGLPEITPPSFSDAASAAFQLENDIVATTNIMREPGFKPTDNYNLLDNVKTYQIDEEDWDYFVGTQSDEELLYRKQKLARERALRDTYARSGASGIALGIAAGVLSPTTFIPFVGTGTKAARIGKAFGYGALAGALQEIPLQTDQLSRTAEESVLSIGASTLTQGLLGSAFVAATKGEIAAIEAGMADAGGGSAISQLNKRPAGVGAEASSVESAGKLKAGPGIDTLSRIGPLTRAIQQADAPVIAGTKYESPQARYMASQFGDAGLAFEGNAKGVAAAPGGTIEHEALSYHKHLYDGLIDVDTAFKDYYFDGSPPKWFANTRATVGSLAGNSKLNLAQFREEVTKTAWTQEPHAVPQINQVAAAINKNVFEPLFKLAQEVKIYKDIEDLDEADLLKGDKGYATRLFLPEQVQKYFNEWTRIVGGKIEGDLNEQFAQEFQKFAERRAKTATRIEDMQLPEAEAVRLRQEFVEKVKKLNEDEHPEITSFEMTLTKLRSDLKKEKDPVKKEALRQKIKSTKETGLAPVMREQYIKDKTVRSAFKTRVQNLLHSRAITEERYLKKLSAIEAVEEASIESVNRAIKRGAEFVNFLRSASTAAINKEIKGLKDDFADLLKVFDRNEIKLARLSDENFSAATGLDRIERQQAQFEKLSALTNKLGELENFDKVAWKQSVEELINEVSETAVSINKRRALRWARLEEQAAKLDPALVPKKVEKLRAQMADHARVFNEKYGVKSNNTLDMDKGTAVFKDYAKDLAADAAKAILKINGRIQFNDLIREKRGPEIARALDISSIDLQLFLEKDIERIMRAYVRTMSADIAVARKFGTANAQEAFDALGVERLDATRKIEQLVDKDGNKLSPEAADKARTDLGKFYNQLSTDLEVLLRRVRHERGIPQDPVSFAARGASIALQLNAMRYMGGVVIASAADPARPVMRYGLTRVFRDAVIPMVTDFKTFKMSAREAKLAGGALDVYLHSRAHTAWDLMDNIRPRTKFEKAVEWGSSRLGLIGLFDYWTAAWKQFTAVLANAKLLDSIEAVVTGKGPVAKATEYLAKKNIVGQDVEVIWREVTGGNGGGKVNGVWLPNTDNWNIADESVAHALRSYRTALLGEMDATIITPGLERPSWVDANIPAKLLAQFKSFGLSSTTKTVMAGLQERDAAHLQGVMASLALGYLSYYLYAVSVGGKTEEAMRNASLAKWTDEAIERSGLLGVFGEVQRVAQTIPSVRPYMSFSGGTSTRREGTDFTEALLGPSADLLQKIGTVVTGLDEPTQATLHAFRQTLPYQNHTLLRRALDKIEESFGLPKERTKE